MSLTVQSLMSLHSRDQRPNFGFVHYAQYLLINLRIRFDPNSDTACSTFVIICRYFSVQLLSKNLKTNVWIDSNQLWEGQLLDPSNHYIICPLVVNELLNPEPCYLFITMITIRKHVLFQVKVQYTLKCLICNN